jgi:phage tail-like protein
MAKINNPRKSFQFSVIIQGIAPFLVQTVKLPDVEIEADEHGDTNYKVKTGGMMSYGNLTISKICEAIPLIDQYIWSWVNTIQNVYTGGGALPSLYKSVILIEQFAPDGKTVLKRWTCEGCWPRRINGIEFNRAQSGNTIENIEFEVDRMQLI